MGGSAPDRDEPAGRAGRRAFYVRAFVAAPVGVPVVATVLRWVTGEGSSWGWQMFSAPGS